MRRLFMLITIFISVNSQAMAAIQTIGNLTADIPAGWSAEQQNSVTVIKSLTRNASIAVAVNPLGEASMTDIAEHLYIQMSGKNLTQDSDGDYTFTYTTTSGAEGFAILTNSGDGRYILMSISGYGNQAVNDEIDAIIDSLEWND